MLLSRRVAVAGLLVGVAPIGACTSVRPIHPTTYLEENPPPVVWVTYNNNTVVAVAEAEVRRDTLRGTLQGARVKIPLADIQIVHAKVRDGGKTALLVGSLGLVAVSTLYFASISKSGSTPAANCGYDQRGFPIQYC